MKPPEQSKCLYAISPQNKAYHGIKVFLAVKERPLELFGMQEVGQTVQAFLKGEVGQDFEVIFYDGRERQAKKEGYEVKVFFGKRRVAFTRERPGTVDFATGQSDTSIFRFTRFKKYRVDDVLLDTLATRLNIDADESQEHVRHFSFAKVATTDNADEACTDNDYLANLSIIKVEYRRVKNMAKEKAATGEKSRKKLAEQNGAAMDAKEGGGSKRSGILDKDGERRLSETADKGTFALAPSFGNLVEDKKKNSSHVAPWSYAYVDEDKVDLTFTFRVRSEARVASVWEREADLEPILSSPPKTVELGDALYLDFDENEARADASASGNSWPVHAGTTQDDSRAEDADGEATDDEADTEDECSDSSAATRAPPAKKHRTAFTPALSSKPYEPLEYLGQPTYGGGAYASGSGVGAAIRYGSEGFWSGSGASPSSSSLPVNPPSESKVPSLPSGTAQSASKRTQDVGGVEDSSPEVSADEDDDLYGPAPGPDPFLPA
ncbi:hypothetical protein JCM11251_005595 [Rhodosporidiobolus azoricus]